MWTLVYFLAFFQYICKLKCRCNPKLFKDRRLLVYTCAVKNSFSVEVVLGISHVPWHPPGMLTSMVISVTNGWWSEKTRQKWENRTLCWVVCPGLKRWWLSKDDMNRPNCQFFSVWIFYHKQQSSFVVAIQNKAKYSQRHCLVNKIQEGIVNGLISLLARLI